MIVDFHSHLAPPPWGENSPIPPTLTDLDGFFARKEEDGIDVTVLSNAMVRVPGEVVDKLELGRIKEWNQWAHGFMTEHPGQIAVMPGINPFGGDEMIVEAQECIRSAGFHGITVNSSVGGRFLDAPELDDFWEAIAGLGVPVFVHPPSWPIGAEGIHHRPAVEWVAAYCDVAVGAAAIVLSGVLERHQDLTLVCAAGGGGLAMLLGRLELARERGAFRPPGQPGMPGGDRTDSGSLPKPIRSYFERVWVDTCSYSEPSLRLVLEQFGADRVVFGTDFPPVDVPASLVLDIINEMPVNEADRKKIRGGNAARVLGLEASVSA
jgi:aminocarboxymuconate-semialdehyde decarboxylase